MAGGRGGRGGEDSRAMNNEELIERTIRVASDSIRIMFRDQALTHIFNFGEHPDLGKLTFLMMIVTEDQLAKATEALGWKIISTTPLDEGEQNEKVM